MKILFVAYYYEPFSGVGAQRVSYWARNLHDLDPNWDVFVVTASEGAKNTSRTSVTVLSNTVKGLWSYLFKTDAGASWAYALKKWLKKNYIYDVVLFTGNPFLHFRIAGWIKKKFGSKIIFDFRDPMSSNPRNNFKTLSLFFKNRIMHLIEREFVKQADLIITVNRWCLPLIERTNQKKTAVIDNGFDESIVHRVFFDDTKIIKKSNKIRFVYAGKFYKDRNPTLLLKVIQNTEMFKTLIEIIHIGKRSEWLEPFRGEEWLIEEGEKNYLETMSILKHCDYGLIFTNGYPFESTTKVFDYMGLGLYFIVFSGQILNTGALVEYAHNYKNAYIIKNDEQDIVEFLNTVVIKSRLSKSPLDYKYSRQAGLKKLLTLINDLDDEAI